MFSAILQYPDQIQILPCEAFKLNIVPYRSFGQISIGESETSVAERLGPFDRRVVNEAGEVEFYYQQIVVRVNGQDGVVEITSRPEHVGVGMV